MSESSTRKFEKVVKMRNGDAGAVEVLFSFSDPVSVKGGTKFLLRVNVVGRDLPVAPLVTKASTAEGAEQRVAQRLGSAFGRSMNWDLAVSEAFAAFVDWRRGSEVESVVSLADIVPTASSWLVDGLIERDVPNLLFSAGGVGKTTLAAALMMSAASGLPFCGRAVSSPCAVLLVDYENSAGHFADTCRRVGVNLPGWKDAHARNVHYLDAGGLPMSELAKELRRKVKELGIGLVVVDSAAPACSGPSEDSDVTKEYFAAVRSLGVTVLTIAHETKAEGNKTYSHGSVYWHNLSRYVLRVTADWLSPHSKRLTLTNTKRNNGAAVAPALLLMTSTATGTQFAFEEPRADDAPLRRLVEERLSAYPGSTAKQIAAHLDEQENAVRTALYRLKSDGRAEKGGKSGTGWSLKAKSD